MKRPLGHTPFTAHRCTHRYLIFPHWQERSGQLCLSAAPYSFDQQLAFPPPTVSLCASVSVCASYVCIIATITIIFTIVISLVGSFSWPGSPHSFSPYTRMASASDAIFPFLLPSTRACHVSAGRRRLTRTVGRTT